MNTKITPGGVFLLFCVNLIFSPPTVNAQVYTLSNNNLPAIGASSQTVDIQAVDLDVDGDLDMVLANEFQVNGILLNDGSATFTNGSGILPPIIHDTDDMVIADFDQDDDLDIILVSEDNFGHEYYVNQGNLLFTQGSILPFSKGTAVVVADLNDDEFPDLIIGNLYNQNISMINDGTGAFINETSDRLPEFNDGTYDLTVFDVDGDGDEDMFVANQDGNKMLINNGAGVFTDETAARLPQFVDMDTRKVTYGDIDGDGDLDLFLANVEFIVGKDPQNRILRNNGDGFFVDLTATHFPTLNDQTTEGVFHDYDADGDLDLFISNVLHNPLLIYQNNGQGSFTDVTDALLGGQTISLDSWGLVIEDLNGDGFKDIYICNRTGKDVLLIGDEDALLNPLKPSPRKESLVLFPNPTANSFTLKVPTNVETSLQFRLSNWSGQLQHELKGIKEFEHQYRFDLTDLHLPPGSYLLNVFSGQELMTKKLMLFKQ